MAKHELIGDTMTRSRDSALSLESPTSHSVNSLATVFMNERRPSVGEEIDCTRHSSNGPLSRLIFVHFSNSNRIYRSTCVSWKSMLAHRSRWVSPRSTAKWTESVVKKKERRKNRGKRACIKGCCRVRVAQSLFQEDTKVSIYQVQLELRIFFRPRSVCIRGTWPMEKKKRPHATDVCSPRGWLNNETTLIRTHASIRDRALRVPALHSTFGYRIFLPIQMTGRWQCL